MKKIAKTFKIFWDFLNGKKTAIAAVFGFLALNADPSKSLDTVVFGVLSLPEVFKLLHEFFLAVGIGHKIVKMKSSAIKMALIAPVAALSLASCVSTGKHKQLVNEAYSAGAENQKRTTSKARRLYRNCLNRNSDLDKMLSGCKWDVQNLKILKTGCGHKLKILKTGCGQKK